MDPILRKSLREWWYGKLKESIPLTVLCSELREDYLNSPKTQHVSSYVGSKSERSLEISIGRFLQSHCKNCFKRRLSKKGSKKMEYYYIFPSIEEARESFSKAVKMYGLWKNL